MMVRAGGVMCLQGEGTITLEVESNDTIDQGKGGTGFMTLERRLAL